MIKGVLRVQKEWLEVENAGGVKVEEGSDIPAKRGNRSKIKKSLCENDLSIGRLPGICPTPCSASQNSINPCHHAFPSPVFSSEEYE